MPGADIDIEADARQQIQDSASQQGGSFENVDLSGLTVRTDPPEFGQPVTVAKQPRQLWSETYRNCSRQMRSVHITGAAHTANTVVVELSARLKLGRGLGTQNKVLETLLLASNISFELDLAGSTRYTHSDDVSRTIDETTQVAPCTELRVGLLESGTVSTISFRIVVHVGGSIRATFSTAHFWQGRDVDMTLPYSHRYVINGTAVVTGVHIDKTWGEFRAECEAGTPCARLAKLSDDEFWGPADSSEGAGGKQPQAPKPKPPAEPDAAPTGHAEDGAPGASKATPQAIWKCGEEFPVVAEGTGHDDPSAEAAAFAEAERIAKTQCPGNCPAQFARKVTVRFGDAPGGGRLAKWFGVFTCRG